MSDGIKRLLELQGQLKYHDHLYHTLDQPVISDSEYDILKSEYDELAEKYPEVIDPKVTIGFVDPPKSLGKVTITEPMISVDKKKDVESYDKWILKNVETEAVEEIKLDGIALRFIYKKGMLSLIHTRGRNGIGGDVSHRRHLITNLKDTVELHEDKDEVHFTGEVYTRHADFLAYCARHKLDPTDTDPRSTVSGLMKRAEASDRDDLPIYVTIYGASRNVRDEFSTYLELRAHIQECGFDVPMIIDPVMRSEMMEANKLPDWEYPIDGIVAKDNDLRKWEVPQTGEHYTYAVCYKFPTILLHTTVTGIDWSLTNKGEFVGTLMYEPVDYGGTKLTRCKFDYMKTYFEKGLRVGSKISVTKSNEIIPKLISLDEVGKGEKLDFPAKCPFCNHQTVPTTISVKCTNSDCEGQVVKRLSTIFSIDAFNIHGLGDKRIEQLVNIGKLTEPADIFKWDDEDLIAGGVPPASTGKIIEAIKNVGSNDLSRWLFALSIPSLGKVRCVELSNMSATNGMNDGLKFHNLQDFLTIITDAQGLSEMFGIEGAKIAAHCKKYEDQISRFLSHYDFGRLAPMGMDGVPVAITGEWNGLTRRDLTEVLRQHDFVLSSSVTKTCKALLTATKPSPAKVETAKRYKLPIFDISSISDVNGIVALLSNIGR